MSNLYSDLKIFKHPDKLNDIENEKVAPPIYARIKPTNRCCHNCYYCSYADKNLNLRTEVIKTDEINCKILKGAIESFAEMGLKAITYSGGGEPLMYPRINEVMQMVLDYNIDLSIITNGQMLTGESARILSEAKWVRISLDSCNSKQFSKIRGVPKGWFDKLINNINNFSKIKNKDCELGINYVVTHNNHQYIYDMAVLARELGINHIKFAPRITKDVISYHKKIEDAVYKQLEMIKPLEDNSFRVIDKYTGDFDEAAKYERSYTFCPMMQITTVIGADANVYMCHDKAYVKNGVIGNLEEKSFKEIWYSEETKKLFKSFNPMCECKHHCMNDGRNILINKYLDINMEHKNFI